MADGLMRPPSIFKATGPSGGLHKGLNRSSLHFKWLTPSPALRYSGTLCKCLVLLPPDPAAPLPCNHTWLCTPWLQMLLQQNKFTTDPLSYSGRAGQGESRGGGQVSGRRVQRRTIKCYDGCLGGRWRGNVKWREGLVRNVAILGLELNREEEEQSEGWQISGLLGHQVEVTFSSHCLFFCSHRRGARSDAGLITGEQILHWWKPLGHAKYLVQCFNISSGPHSHRV